MGGIVVQIIAQGSAGCQSPPLAPPPLTSPPSAPYTCGMDEQRNPKDRLFAIIAIAAGLITGTVLTWAFLTPEDAPRYIPEYRVAEEQRVPLGSAEATAEGGEPAEAASDPSSEGASGADRAAIEGAQTRLDAEGVTDYVELTEELYIRVSAKLVIAAAALGKALGPDADPTEAQHLLAEKTADELAAARIDPDEYWEFTRGLHSDPARAEEMGEKILQEAEKHTQYRINFKDIESLEPTPVPGTEP